MVDGPVSASNPPVPRIVVRRFASAGMLGKAILGQHLQKPVAPCGAQIAFRYLDDDVAYARIAAHSSQDGDRVELRSLDIDLGDNALAIAGKALIESTGRDHRNHDSGGTR